MGIVGMNGLVIRDKNREILHYSGTQFEGLGNIGAHHLCVRTGNKPDDIVKYGLTSKPINDKYKALRIQKHAVSESVSPIESYTSSRESSYISSQTLVTQSRTALNTVSTTNKVTHSPIYYGNLNYTYTTTCNKRTSSLAVDGNCTPPTNLGPYINATSHTKTFSFTTPVAKGKWTINAMAGLYTVTVTGGWYKVTKTQTSYAGTTTSLQTLSTASKTSLITNTATRSSQFTTTRARLNEAAYIAQRYSVSISASSSKNTTASRVSNYTSSQTLSTASRTSLSTRNATRTATQDPIYYATSSRHWEGTITGTQTYSYKITKTSSSSQRTSSDDFYFAYASSSLKIITGISSTTFITNNLSVTERWTSYYNTFKYYMSSGIDTRLGTYYAYSTQMISYVSFYHSTVTKVVTSRVSNYASSYATTQASSSSLSTKYTTRSSQFSTSSQYTTTQSAISHNVNI